MAAYFGIIIKRCNRVVIIVYDYDEPLAQLAEHLTFNQRVWGSNPQWLTRKNPINTLFEAFSDNVFLFMSH